MSHDLDDYEKFLNDLTEAYAPGPDRLLWQLEKQGRTISCTLREIRPAQGFASREIRLAHNGEIFRTESHADFVACDRRVQELRAEIEVHGWTLIASSPATKP